MKRLELLVQSGELSPIDVELGGLLARRAAAQLGVVDEVRLVGLAGAMLSSERSRGNSCVELSALAGAAMPWADVVGPPPDATSWRSLLERSGLCGDGATPSPLVLDDGRLYLYRYHAAECRLAKAIRARIGATVPPPAGTSALFRRLFDAPSDAGTDLQAVAAAASLRGRFTVITGGPGTGKTTTVAKILALLLDAEPELRIALAAPTGKAASRLADSVADNVARLPLDDALRSRIPVEGRTLHRLLGYQPWNDGFAHGPGAPLGEDVVIVDEASMVDVLMMDVLFGALRAGTRVILLGDRDQLASVDTGYVLSDLCDAADASGADTPLRNCVVRLTRSYRFESQPGIGALAEAIRSGNAAAALGIFGDGSRADVNLREPARSVAELLSPVENRIDAYLDARGPDEALERFGEFRILCAVREGSRGVEGLNERIEEWLRRRGVQTRARWYHGKPVLVTANDPATGLYNGDVGVTVAEGGQARIWFRDGAGKPRPVSPARLPAHETAWAMTVHKAQGSEFAHVLFVLPEDDSPVLTRELLYTGVTRARTRVDVSGSSALFQRAVERATTRSSGLVARLLE